jgi:BASS family bile acid:Na+ symporter
MFAAGYGLARALDATRADTASMMFGLGMNNNGTALVLASTALAEHPQVMLPVILYNLVQHFAASIVDRAASRS